MRTLVKVIELKVLSHPQLWLRFSDGSAGVRDLSDVLAEGGPMIEPLREAKLFARAFVQSGVPTWPNGFDLDAIALHDEMGAAGLLGPAQAA